MVRALVTVVLAAGMVGIGTGAVAAPLPQQRCVLTDERLAEVSGLVADGEHWYLVNDGGRESRVYVLDRDCRVERVITGTTDPYDVEDLGRTADGTLWLSDTGDNDKRRDTVALIALAPDGTSTLYRLTYPDGAHDTEALLLDAAGTPHLVTKNPFGRAEVYRPAGELTSPGPTPLEHVTTLTFQPTDTKGGPITPSIGSMVVTGGATSPDGTVIALRTYTDAYLYPAPDGDLVAALGREPRRIPLPDEPQGEAIALEPDGTLVSVSENAGTPVRVVPEATAGLIPEPEPEAVEPPVAAAGDGSGGLDGGGDGLATLPAIGVTVVVVGGLLLIMHRRASRRG